VVTNAVNCALPQPEYNARMALDNLKKALEKEYNKMIYGQGGLI
jgi:hypothetical protein